MPQFRLTIEEIVPRVSGAAEIGAPIERLRVTVDATGALDHAAIIAAVQKTKRVYAPRKAKVTA